MIYNSLDIIPFKLYLKISETNNLSLLYINGVQDEDLKGDVLKDLKRTWKKLRKDYNKLGLSAKAQKIVDVHTRVETLKTKYDYINASCNALNFDRDLDIENSLREFGYKLTESEYMKNLKRIKAESSNIKVKIKRLEATIKRISPNTSKNEKTSIDKLILGYMSATGITYNTNDITVTQFHGLKSLFDDKIDKIEEQNAKNKDNSNRKK